MPRDLGIASRLRAAGLRVVEVAGWQTRGNATFNPRGSVNHHTAGAASGNAPSLTTCIYGRPGLPGPLCQVLMARDLTCYVIAAGRANHAGAGRWAGLTGNSSVWGLEIEHTGTGPSGAQLRAAVLVHAALLGPGANAGLVCQHSEWAPTRKIDFRSLGPDYTAASFRSAVAARLRAPAPPAPSPTPPEEDDDMPATKRLVHAKKVAYVLPDGTICDQDIDGKQMLDGSRGDDAMRAVYLSPVANEVQVDRAKIVVRLGAAARANNGGDALLRRLSDQLRAVELRLEAVQNAVVTPR